MYGQVIQSGKMIDAATMDADISYAAGTCKLLSLVNSRGVSLSIASASASQDHDGVIYIRACNDDEDTPVALPGYAIEVDTSALVNEVIDLGKVNAKYLEVFYDRTGGGASDTLTVKATVDRG